MINSFRDGPTIDWSKLRKKILLIYIAKGKLEANNGISVTELLDGLFSMICRSSTEKQLGTTNSKLPHGGTVKAMLSGMSEL
jgi:hypothetical protein